MTKEKIKQYLEKISSEEFEKICVQYLRKTRGDNLRIKGTRFVKDGGKDIIGTSDSVPYEIWAECKKHTRSLGLDEISKNVVLVISEGINELVFFSVSNITADALKHISNVSAKRDFSVSFYYGEILLDELASLPMFSSDDEADRSRNKIKDYGLIVKHYLSKYKYSSIYEKSNNISLQRDCFFYIDIYLKNMSFNKISNIFCKIDNTPYFKFKIKRYHSYFSLNPRCDRVIQIKCEILNTKRVCKIPDIYIYYELDSVREKILYNGYADALSVIHFPLIGSKLNNFVYGTMRNKLNENSCFPFILNICGNSGVGKSRLIREIENLAEEYSWNIKSYDAKKQGDFRIFKELLASFIGIPYYSGNINVTEKDIRSILLLHDDEEDIAGKIYSFLFEEKFDNDLIYYIEDAFLYFLKNPYLRYAYVISIDNIQSMDDSALEFLEHIITKLEKIETHLILILSTNIELITSEKTYHLLDILDEYDDIFCFKSEIDDMSPSDAKALYAHLLDNPGDDFLTMLINKSGRRPFDIAMTVKYLQERYIISWKTPNTWYINDYETFHQFLNEIPGDNKKMLKKRLNMQKKNQDYWKAFKIVVKTIIYFQGKAPIDFLLYIGVNDELQEAVCKSLFVKYDIYEPYLMFFHDNILRFFEIQKMYSYDRALAKKIIEWFHLQKDSYEIMNRNSILFKCFIDAGNYKEAYDRGKKAIAKYYQYYNFEEAVSIWTEIINKPGFQLNLLQEFDARYQIANCYCKHLDHLKGAKLFNELYDFYQLNIDSLSLSIERKDKFFHELINANIIINQAEKAISICQDFEMTRLSSTFYRLILYDRYALAYLIVGNLENAIKYIDKAVEIAEKEDKNLWKSLVYSDYGFIAYRLMEDKDMTNTYFKKAFNFQDKDNQTMHRKSELLHQYAFSLLLDKKYAEANSNALKAVKICHSLNSSFMESKSLNVLAISYIGLNDWDHALQHLNNASYLCARTGNENTHIKIYINLGAFYYLQDNMNSALSNLEIALQKFEKTTYAPTSYRELFYNLAILYSKLLRDKESRQLSQKYPSINLDRLISEIHDSFDINEFNFEVLRINGIFFSF